MPITHSFDHTQRRDFITLSEIIVLQVFSSSFGSQQSTQESWRVIMAPDIGHMTSRGPIELRVPPIESSNPDILLRNFPELCECMSNPLNTTTRHLSFKKNAEKNQTQKYQVSSGSDGTFQAVVCSPSQSLEQDVHKPSGEEFLENDSCFSEDLNESTNTSPESADDLFDMNYVLPANTEWWQMEPDVSLPLSDDDYDVVDVPHFGSNPDCPNQWSDVDTFLSVVDCRAGGAPSPDRHEPVYGLDERVTTIWGLDIIWEEEDDDEEEKHEEELNES